MRVARNLPVLVRSPRFVAADGETPGGCDDPPTCTVTDPYGTVLAAPTVAAVENEAGAYTAQLLADVHTADLGALTLSWAGEVDTLAQTHTQTVEVISGHLATIPELRAMPGCSEADGVSVVQLRAKRDRFAEIAEGYRGVSYQQRLGHTSFEGGRSGFWLPWPHVTGLEKVTVNGAEVTSECNVELAGWLSRPASFLPPPLPGQLNCQAWFTHGYEDPPELVREACREYVSQSITRAGSAMRNVVYQSVDGMLTRYSAADGKDKPTGFEDVDDLLRQLDNEIRFTG